ncbi:MAG: hypothetical protein AAGC46_04650 [Solirubrobacteraceae bacterium]|nr:hypothetical protein [Patulibacter sp.]
MLPRADFPDPLVQERRRRTRTYFSGHLRRPWVIVTAIVACALAFVHPALVPVAWVVMLIVAWSLAQRRAQREWWQLLGDRFHMHDTADADLLPATPLLRSGDEREVVRGLEDASRRLAQFRSTDVRRDDEGTHRTHHDYTVVFSVDATASIRFLSAHEHRWSPVKWLGDDHRGRFPRDVDDFRCESVELHEQYELRSSNEDETQARRVFSPTFMVWFTRQGLPFEYEAGSLVVFVDRVLDHAEEYRVLLQRAQIIRDQIAGRQPDLGAVTGV